MARITLLAFLAASSVVAALPAPAPAVSSVRARCRNASTARRFAVVMSQAPGLSGMPEEGHWASAATMASCAKSSARPTSRTMRTSAAMSRVDSSRQTASIAARVVSSPTRA